VYTHEKIPRGFPPCHLLEPWTNLGLTLDHIAKNLFDKDETGEKKKGKKKKIRLRNKDE
jgi:hypothetical protein